MPRWCLSLPPPAAPTLPSHLHRSSSPITVDSPSHRPLMSSCSRAVHRHPSPPITVHRHAVHHRQVAIAPSLSVHHHCLAVKPLLSTVHHRPVSIAVTLSIAVSHPAGCCVSSRHADASCPPIQDFPHGMFNLFLMRDTIL